MAKKKSETSNPSAAKAVGTKAASTKAPAKKAVGKKTKKPAMGGGAPLVDTTFAAEAAARMLAARAKLKDTSSAAGDSGKESSAFKQLKEGLNKPHAQTAAAALGNSLGPAKQNLPQHGGHQQVAHNQTYGGASRVNVPRRTAG